MSLKTLNNRQKTFCFTVLFLLSSSITYFTLDSVILRYYYNDINKEDVLNINESIKKQSEILNVYSKERDALYSIINDEKSSNLDKKIAVNNLYQKISKIDEGTANVLLYFPVQRFDSKLSEQYLSKGLYIWQKNSSLKKYFNFISICNKKWYCNSFIYKIMLYKKDLSDYKNYYNDISIINNDIQKTLLKK